MTAQLYYGAVPYNPYQKPLARKVATETPKSTSHRWISAVMDAPIQTQLPILTYYRSANLRRAPVWALI
jgi:hypothetical protein